MAGSGRWWLRVPARAGYELTLHVENDDLTFATTMDQGEFQVLGRRGTVVRQGERAGMKTNLSVRVKGDVEYQRLQTVIGFQEVCELETPTGIRWQVVIGDVQEIWVGNSSYATRPTRVLTLALTEVG